MQVALMPQENIVSVETISGRVLRFVVDQPEVIAKQLKAMDPEDFFQRNQIFFSHASILAGISCSKIALVRFEFPLDTGWTFPLGASRVEIIDKEQFESQVEVKRVQTKVALKSAILGADISTMHRVNLVNGTVLHFRVAVKIVPAAIRMQNVEHATALKTYFAFTKSGYIVVNRAAVEYWHAFPGPLIAPADAISFTEQLPDKIVGKA